MLTSVPRTNKAKSILPPKTRRENLPQKTAAGKILANPPARPLNPQYLNIYGAQNQNVRKGETTPTTVVMTVGFAKKKLELISNIKILVKLPSKEVPESHSGNLKGYHAGAAKLCLALNTNATFVAKIIQKGNALIRTKFTISSVTQLNSQP
jgi:hypothetical protein